MRLEDAFDNLLDDLAKEVIAWIEDRKSLYDDSCIEGWCENYCEDHDLQLSADAEKALRAGFEYGMEVALDDLIGLLDGDGWETIDNG